MGFRDSALRKLSNVSSKPGHLKLPSVRPPSCYVYYISYSIHKCARINYETSLICAGYHGLNVRSLPNYQAPLLAKSSSSSSSSSSRFSFFILSFFHYCFYINRTGRSISSSSFSSPPIYYSRFRKCIYKQNLRDILRGRNLLSYTPPLYFSTFITRV